MIKLNTIYNEDCLIGMTKIASKSVDVILTDPPYLYLKNQKLDREFDEKAFFSEAKRVLKKNGFIVLFGRGSSFYRWNTILADFGFTFKEEVVWDKQYSTSPTHKLMRTHETISIHTKGKGIINKVKVPYIEAKFHDINSICNDIKRLASVLNNQKDLAAVKDFLNGGKPYRDGVLRQKSSVTITKNSTQMVNVSCMVMQMFKDGMVEKSIIRNPYDKYSRIHPTQKPVRLLERLLALVNKDCKVVLDPFSGSGNTAIACINMNLNYICFEIDKEYYDLSIDNIEKKLNQKQ